ncbi:MAG: cytochrome b/b6 domain protein [Acidimicrobiaceae bacterium]|nr:cytochrome b/b6 domain protein [Acidimicrobiaceae bacterium]
MIDNLFNWIDDRLAISRGGRHLLNKIFPDHWSFMLGEIALYSFIVLLLTGIFLTLYFVPSESSIVYHGAYLPIDGQHVSQAFASTLDITFSVRGGLLIRQMHHWAANIFIGSAVVHLLRIFFTGGFRRPREVNWIVGANLLILGIFNGFLGYSLPDDLVSGTGIRIAFSILESVPFAGSYLATFLFGGNFPGNGAIIPRFFIIQVLILPLAILGLLSAHLGMLVRHKHTQFKTPGAREDNVVGTPLWPTFMTKTLAFFFLTTGITVLLGAVAQINPIWQYGQYYPWKVSYAVQPDWYMGWLDGALRVMPSWEIHLPGHMIPNVFFPAVLLPGITFTVLMMYPFIEERLTGNVAEHHLLDRPRDRPVRTAFGCAVFAFYFVLFGASATDVLANYLNLSLNFVLWTFRILCIVVPIVVFPVAYKICKELEGVPEGGKRKVHNLIVRDPAGGYSTIPAEEYPGYESIELEPVDVEKVESLTAAAAAKNGDGRTEGVYEIPREYR